MPKFLDDVQVCNLALSNIGSSERVESLDEVTAQGNKATRVCLLWYRQSLQETLEVFDWSFARTSQELSLHSQPAPKNRWQFRYRVPDDYVLARLIENPAGPDEDPVPFELESADGDTVSVLTNQPEAVLIYTFFQEAINVWSSHFVKMFQTRLALNINWEMTGKMAVRDRLDRDFARFMEECPGTDVASRMERKERPASWTTARN